MIPAKRRRVVEVPGARLFVQESGDPRKTPVILLHGGPGLPGYMSVLAESLADDAFIVDYYQRGARKSPSAGPFRIADHVRDLDAIVRRYSNGSRPVVLGHSWGAVLALSYAAARPGRLAKTILVGCGPLDPACSERFSATIAARLPYAEFLEAQRLKGRLFSKTLPDGRRSQRYLDWCGVIMRVYNVARGGFDVSALEKPDVASALATDADYERRIKSGALLKTLGRISDPLVAFHGDYDPIPWEAILPRVAEGPRRRTHLLPRMGHIPWLERGRGRFLALLRREIAGLWPAAPESGGTLECPGSAS